MTDDRTDWLRWRSGAGTPDAPTLGATDCAALIAEAAGHPTFRGAEDVYRDRWRGRPPEDPSTRLMLALGHAAERPILDEWHARRGLTRAAVDEHTLWLTHPVYPWLRGSLDAPPVAHDGGRHVVDAKTYSWGSSKFHAADGSPCWPLPYLTQLSIYAAMLAARGIPTTGLGLAICDLGSLQYGERAALLTDPVSLHLDPAAGPELVTSDGDPMSVADLGIAAIAYAEGWRAAYLLGDTPPAPPPGTDALARWLALLPRTDKSARPTTDAEADLIALALTAGAEEAAAKGRKDTARRAIVEAMSPDAEADRVQRVYGPTGSASIGKAGILTVKPPKS
jgi:hypothetical protein